jgi:hypothetical protein
MRMKGQDLRSSSTRLAIPQGIAAEIFGCGSGLTWCRYADADYEYRHVQLPKAMLKVIPRDYFDDSKGTLKLLWEEEWRGLGITQVCREIPFNIHLG